MTTRPRPPAVAPEIRNALVPLWTLAAPVTTDELPDVASTFSVQPVKLVSNPGLTVKRLVVPTGSPTPSLSIQRVFQYWTKSISGRRRCWPMMSNRTRAWPASLRLAQVPTQSNAPVSETTTLMRLRSASGANAWIAAIAMSEKVVNTGAPLRNVS